jgi:hypothetical protein
MACPLLAISRHSRDVHSDPKRTVSCPRTYASSAAPAPHNDTARIPAAAIKARSTLRSWTGVTDGLRATLPYAIVGAGLEFICECRLGMFVKGDKDRRESNMRRLFQVLTIQCAVALLAQSGVAAESKTTVTAAPGATAPGKATEPGWRGKPDRSEGQLTKHDHMSTSCPEYGSAAGVGKAEVTSKCPPWSFTDEARAVATAQRAAQGQGTCNTACPNKTWLEWKLTSVACAPNGETVIAKGAYEYRCDN